MTSEYGGWAGRVMVFLRIVAQLVAINLLMIGGTLLGGVLLGLFPALGAGSALLARLVAGDPSESMLGDFWAAYRAGFRRLNLLGAPFWVLGVFLWLDVLFLRTVDGAAASALLVGVSVMCAWLVVSLAYLFPAARRSDDGAARVWRFVALAPLLAPLTGLSVLVTLLALAVIVTQLTVLVPLASLSLPLALTGWVVDRRLDTLGLARAS